MRRLGLILAVCLFSAALAGCSLRTPPKSEDYYAQGQLDFANGDYNAAIENYQHLVDRFPFSPYVEDAELKIGLAHFKMHQYAEAVASLDDFQRMHPTSKNLDLVSYYIAMSYFNQMGRADQDQTAAQRALGYFQELQQRYPESNFAELAREKAETCREMLARHEKYIGDFYFKRANFRAAESRYAELMQKYPNTPVAPSALWDLGVALEKEGKKYSAAQAFAAMVSHYPQTQYANRAKQELDRLKQPVDNEEDPLRLVLAENGYGEDLSDNNRVVVRQAQQDGASGSDDALYSNGLPNLSRALQKDPGAKAAGSAGDQSAPALLKTVRLASSDPPLSVIFDLTRPVKYEKRIEKGPGYSTLTVLLKGVHPEHGLQRHVVFDRSIFKDCNISTDPQGTVVTVNTVPVASYAVVPLESPARLLVTFTPENSASNDVQNPGY
jgi:outer membrane protein assembly factor BamD